LIVPQFGPDSFAAHQAAAQASGVPARIYRAPGLAFDLDTPDDWWTFVSCVSLESGQHSC
jgi:2-phospho-L-lactate guanylyltransferase (CobY/MobA/RfbA family)